MKHTTTIQKEFLKEANKWEQLSYKTQEKYLKKHPKSKRKLLRNIQEEKRQEREHKVQEIRPQQESKIDFQHEEKATNVMQKAALNNAKDYLTNLSNYLKDNLEDVTIPEIKDDGDRNAILSPVKIGNNKFEIRMDINYPKIRCKRIGQLQMDSTADDIMDSQSPKSLLRKIKKSITL